MKLCLTLLTALLFCAATASVSFAEDKSAKDGGNTATAEKAAAKEKAGKGAAAKKAKALRGKVVRVDGDKLVLDTGTKKEPKEVTVTAGADTKVMIDGHAGKLADLKAGQQVSVTPAEGTPQSITAAAAKVKKDTGDKPAKKA
jgi:hypothetical protein